MNQNNGQLPTRADGEEKCPECGAIVSGGHDGCQLLFEGLGYQASSNPKIAATHWLIVDTYCMQHVERYGVSAKSYAAHLMGLCCGIEHGSNHVIYSAIQRWLNGSVALKKLEILSHRGDITVVDVQETSDFGEELQGIRKWANSVWEAYATQHELARTWLQAAIVQRSNTRRG